MVFGTLSSSLSRSSQEGIHVIICFVRGLSLSFIGIETHHQNIPHFRVTNTPQQNLGADEVQSSVWSCSSSSTASEKHTRGPLDVSSFGEISEQTLAMSILHLE